MQIQLDGAAIKELVAALEAAEGDDARAAVDKRIVKRGADIAKPDMARRIPRAADHKNRAAHGLSPPAARLPTTCRKKTRKIRRQLRGQGGLDAGRQQRIFLHEICKLGHAENAAPRFCGAYRPGRGTAAAKIAEEEYQAELDKRLGRFE